MVETASKRSEREKMLATIEYCRPYRGLIIGSKHPVVWAYGDVILELDKDVVSDPNMRAESPFSVYIRERTHPKHYTQRRQFQVIPTSVGQSLGMIDKEGKEAYLDDIVFLEPKNLRRIVWYDNRFCLTANGSNINISFVRSGVIVSNAHQLEKYGNG